MNMGIETGVFGITKSGTDILKAMFELYENGKFSQIKRWDDGYVLRHVLKQKTYKTYDMSENASKLNALEVSKWAKYVVHLKGHNRLFKLGKATK